MSRFQSETEIRRKIQAEIRPVRPKDQVRTVVLPHPKPEQVPTSLGEKHSRKGW